MCAAQLTQEEFETSLSWNVTASTMAQIEKQNSMPGNKVNQTTHGQDVKCKLWYAEIVSNLGIILNGIRRQQMLCCIDTSLIDRSQDCYTVVQLAAPTADTNATNPVSSLPQIELGESLDSSTEQGSKKYIEYARDLFASVKAELEEQAEVPDEDGD